MLISRTVPGPRVRSFRRLEGAALKAHAKLREDLHLLPLDAGVRYDGDLIVVGFGPGGDQVLVAEAAGYFGR